MIEALHFHSLFSNILQDQGQLQKQSKDKSETSTVSIFTMEDE